MPEKETELPQKTQETNPGLPQEIIIPKEAAPLSESQSSTENQEALQKVRQEINGLTTTTKTVDPKLTTEQELDSQFFSVDDYFKKGNTNKTGYAILGYEAMEPITFWKTIIKSAKKYLPDRANRHSMVDVGCAYGYLLKHISSEFDHTIGIDISHTALKKAKEISPTSLLLETDLNQNVIPLEAGSQDMITLLDSVEHVKQPDALLKEAGRILKKGGLAVISTPDIGNWFGRLIAKANGDPSHISLFAQKDLITKLEENGFEVLEKRPFFPLGPIRIPIPANIEIVLRKK